MYNIESYLPFWSYAINAFLVDLIVAMGCRAYRPGEEQALYNGLQQILGNGYSPLGHH